MITRWMITGMIALAFGAFCTLIGCATFEEIGPSYSATATVPFRQDLPRTEARRAALLEAESQAQDKLLEEAGQLRLSDGRTLAALAVADPFVHAVLRDTIRASQVKERVYGKDETVTVTIRMPLEPLYRVIEEYPRTAAQ